MNIAGSILVPSADTAAKRPCIYLTCYGLREPPFRPTPDPRFLFQSSGHREALARLVYGVRERKEFMLLTGEIGTGKTTLLRALLERCDARTRVAYVRYSALDIQEVLEYALQDWGVKSAAASPQPPFELNEFLIDQHRQGLSPVLVVDEAQSLSIDTLEAMRLLANFETTSQKPMPILLVGQPELRMKLDTQELRQLKQRIALRCHIAALSAEETGLYVRHRLRVAGAADAGIFTDGAVQQIAEYSGGMPRTINTVCDHCLLIGHANSKRRIDGGMVAEAIAYLEDGERPHRTRRRQARPVPSRAVIWAVRAEVGLLVLLLATLLVLAALVLADGPSSG